MGLFYNYNKEGPGVSKNAPKKRAFFAFFEILFKNLWKLVPVCFFYWLLFIIPGLSAVGMTYVTRSISRNKHTFGVSDFFSAIKKNWKQALGIGILNLIITAFLAFDISYFYSMTKMGSTFGTVGLGIIIFITIIFLVMKCYIWFIAITFDMKVKTIYLNSFKFFFVNLLNNAAMLLSIGVYWAIIFFLLTFFASDALVAGILAIITIFFYPTFHYLVIQFGVFSGIKKYMIDPYYEEHPDADIEYRRNLGLDVGENEESDFSDLI